MDNISVPVNFVAIHQGDYRELLKDSEDLRRLKDAAFAGIYWKRYTYDNSLDVEYDNKNVLMALRFLFPDDYKDTVETLRESFLTAEAKEE